VLPSVRGVPDALISGWSVNGIVTVRSGFPSTVALAQDNLNNGLSSYPNQVANPNSVSNRSLYNWWNPSAFVIPPFGIQGNAGRNTLLGPGLRTANLSAVKIVPIREGKERFEFRGEFYNAFKNLTVRATAAVCTTAKSPLPTRHCIPCSNCWSARTGTTRWW